MDDPVDGLKALSVDGKGFDDVFVYVPARPVAELGNKILGYDGCMNLFAGPTDSEFSADVNLYDCHYNATKILGSTGGSIDDMKEAIDRAARKEIKPAVMITHVGGIDSIVDTTMNLPNIPGGKKLSYLHINMPMTAISDLRSLAKDDPFFNELADICDRHNGLWSAEAEKALLTHYGVE
jgi:NADPH:quinone reductase-like Zn-dependent oxidoreductase